MTNAMTREGLEELLPDYLGGELNAEARDRFEAALAQHLDFCAEVRNLSSAVDALRSLDAERARLPLAPVRSRARIVSTVLRYAAAISLAFTLGYVLRGANTNPSEIAIGTTTPTVGDLNDRAAFEQRLIEGYARGSGAGTNLGRSLIALAHASNTTLR